MTDVAVIHPNESVPMLPASNAITPSDMIARALERGASIETLEKLITLQERWEANQARRAFDEAVSAAKADIQPAIRNKVGHNSRKYADFASVAAAVDPVIGKHGLSYRFRTKQEGSIAVTCILSHRGGHSEENTLSGPADQSGNKNAIQAIGSTMSYLMRYSLVQALGLSTVEDDDGKASQTGTANPISADDAASLRAKMQAAGLSEARFCTVMKIETIEDLPSSKYDEAERRIMDFSNAKRARDNAN
jgi:hypothetical protein